MLYVIVVIDNIIFLSNIHKKYICQNENSIFYYSSLVVYYSSIPKIGKIDRW